MDFDEPHDGFNWDDADVGSDSEPTTIAKELDEISLSGELPSMQHLVVACCNDAHLLIEALSASGANTTPVARFNRSGLAVVPLPGAAPQMFGLIRPASAHSTVKPSMFHARVIARQLMAARPSLVTILDRHASAALLDKTGPCTLGDESIAPPGTIVSGLAAAFIEQCMVTGTPHKAVLDVDQGAAFIKALDVSDEVVCRFGRMRLATDKGVYL